MTQFDLRISSSVKKKVLLIFHEHGKVGLNINGTNEIRVKGKKIKEAAVTGERRKWRSNIYHCSMQYM